MRKHLHEKDPFQTNHLHTQLQFLWLHGNGMSFSSLISGQLAGPKVTWSTAEDVKTSWVPIMHMFT
jgi:hypothetical protein